MRSFRPQTMNAAVHPPFLPNGRYAPPSACVTYTSSHVNRSAVSWIPANPNPPRFAMVTPGASTAIRHGSRAATSRVRPGPAPRTVTPSAGRR